MKTMIRQEMRIYLRNPILWIGMAIILFELFQMLNPYLTLHYFTSDQEIQSMEEPEDITDRSILQGYVVSTEEERMDRAFTLTEKDLIKEGLPEGAVLQAIQHIRQKEIPAKNVDLELQALLGEEQYAGFLFDYYYVVEAVTRKATPDEANQYIQDKMDAHSYSWYFAKKFADFCGLFMGFFAAILLAFLFLQDSKKDMYELLHTKPLKPSSYVTGKIGGGFLVMLMVWGIFTVIFGVLCEIHGRSVGLPVNIWDFVSQSAIYILPCMLMITCVYAAVALIFKNPLPGIPLLFLYMVYSNMGSTDAGGNYGYFGRPLAIMVRFPGDFLDTAPPPMAAFNQTFLLIASAAVVGICIFIWKRRRFY